MVPSQKVRPRISPRPHTYIRPPNLVTAILAQQPTPLSISAAEVVNCLFLWIAFEHRSQWYLQSLADFEQPRGADAVCAAFILLNLLICDA
jgi:hypothetical protein